MKTLIVALVLLAPTEAGSQTVDIYAALQSGIYAASRYCVNDRVDDTLCAIIGRYTPNSIFFYKQHAQKENDISIEEKRIVIKRIADELMGRP